MLWPWKKTPVRHLLKLFIEKRAKADSHLHTGHEDAHPHSDLDKEDISDGATDNDVGSPPSVVTYTSRLRKVEKRLDEVTAQLAKQDAVLKKLQKRNTASVLSRSRKPSDGEQTSNSGSQRAPRRRTGRLPVRELLEFISYSLLPSSLSSSFTIMGSVFNRSLFENIYARSLVRQKSNSVANSQEQQQLQRRQSGDVLT